jgi:hypothetical protein
MGMKRSLGILSVLILGFCAWAPAQTTSTPDWLRFVGDGSSGAFSCNSGTCVLGDEHWYSSFNVAAGATVVTTGQNGPIIIRSTGTCTINGLVSDSPNSGAGITITGSGDFGGGGGGGGGGSSSGHAGKLGVGDGGLPIVNGGGAGAGGGGNGGNGSNSVINQYRMLISSGSFWPVGGAAGGQGGGPGGAQGGTGGGPIIFVCNTIHFSGTIDVSGGQGGNSSGPGNGAGGGGGAGYVILSAVNYTATNGTMNTQGGPGGSCNGNSTCGAGGKGGNGFSVTMTIQ